MGSMKSWRYQVKNKPDKNIEWIWWTRKEPTQCPSLILTNRWRGPYKEYKRRLSFNITAYWLLWPQNRCFAWLRSHIGRVKSRTRPRRLQNAVRCRSAAAVTNAKPRSIRAVWRANVAGMKAAGSCGVNQTRNRHKHRTQTLIGALRQQRYLLLYVMAQQENVPVSNEKTQNCLRARGIRCNSFVLRWSWWVETRLLRWRKICFY